MASPIDPISKDVASVYATPADSNTPSSSSIAQEPFKKTYYRTTFFQATIVGLAAFAAPGKFHLLICIPYLILLTCPLKSLQCHAIYRCRWPGDSLLNDVCFTTDIRFKYLLKQILRLRVQS
jgi:hypothetical protein